MLILIITLGSLASCNNNKKNKVQVKPFKAQDHTISSKHLDSIYHEYISLKTDDQKLSFYNFNIVEYPFASDSNLRILDHTIEELRSIKDQEGLKLFLEVKANYYFVKKEYLKALSYYDSCILLEEKTGNMNFLGHLYERQQFVYWEMNLNQLGVKSLYKSIECFKKSGNLAQLGNMYFRLGNLYSLNQQYEKACNAFVYSTQTMQDSFNKSIAWIFAARSLIKTGELKLAGEYILKGKSLIHSPMPYQPFYYYYVYGTWLSAMNRKKEALQNFKIAVPLAVSGGQLYQKATTLADMAEIYIGLEHYDSAKNIIFEAIRIADSVNVVRSKINTRNVLSKYYEAIGQDKKALKEYKIWLALNDSIHHSEISSALEATALETEFNQKNAQMAKEQRIKDEAEKEKLRKQKSITYFSLISLLFIGFIAFLIWRNNLLQKKANALISAEKQRSEDLLLNILPYEVAEELKVKGRLEAKQFDQVSVLFTDFKDFTQISETMSAAELVEELNTFFVAFDKIITRLNIEKIKTIGDSYMCAAGLPYPSDSHAEAVVMAGLEIQQFVELHSIERSKRGLIPLQIRIGIHSGSVVAGIVGLKKYAYDIWGDTVNTASRMESSGEAGKVNISSSTYELIKDKFHCTPRGKIIAKHKGEMEMYFVNSVI